MMEKWNGNDFTVYNNSLSMLEIVKEIPNKTDKNGDHPGTWQGLSKPTLSEEGAHAQTEKNMNDIKDIVDGTPYEEYKRTMEIDHDGKYKSYNGFSNFSKKTYGRYEQATVISAIANSDNPIPQVLGTDTKGLANYTNRDSVSLYVENTGRTPVKTIVTGVTYTADTVVLPTNTDMKDIRVGMVIDIGTTVNSDWCVGIIKEIKDNVLNMEDGFYLVRNDGGTSYKIVPSNGLPCVIQNTNKVWGINSNIFIEEGCPSGANIELGVFSRHSNINDVGGIDLVNGGKNTHYGIKVRKGLEGKFIDGYISDGNGRHFVGKGGDYTTPLVQAVDDKGNVFEVRMDGVLTHLAIQTHVMTSSGTIPHMCGIVILNGDNINATLPYANEITGRTLKIVSLGINNLVTAQSGNGIITPEVSQQQISVGKGAKNMYTTEIFSDGGNSWFSLT